jgi:hypothetical protein
MKPKKLPPLSYAAGTRKDAATVRKMAAHLGVEVPDYLDSDRHPAAQCLGNALLRITSLTPKWVRFTRRTKVPASAEVVAVVSWDPLSTLPTILVFRRPESGWSKFVGWDFYCVVPLELHWISRIGM